MLVVFEHGLEKCKVFQKCKDGVEEKKVSGANGEVRGKVSS